MSTENKPSADVSAGDKSCPQCGLLHTEDVCPWEKEPATDDVDVNGQNELLRVVQAAYLKHHVGLDNIGWDALSGMMQNALCNAMGDTGFQRWLEENTK